MLAEVTDALRDVLRDAAITVQATTRFADIPGWDPMDLVSVVVELECRLNLMFDLQEIDRLITVGDLGRMIATKQALAVCPV
jgi:acyl carrier protein